MSGQTHAPFKSAKEENPKETGAIPKKKTHIVPENDATINSASDNDCYHTKPDVKTDRIVNYLLKSISEKEAELECPVCLTEVEPGAAIFSCQHQHLLCSDCRPLVSECPECREKYSQPPLREGFI